MRAQILTSPLEALKRSWWGWIAATALACPTTASATELAEIFWRAPSAVPLNYLNDLGNWDWYSQRPLDSIVSSQSSAIFGSDLFDAMQRRATIDSSSVTLGQLKVSPVSVLRWDYEITRLPGSGAVLFLGNALQQPALVVGTTLSGPSELQLSSMTLVSQGTALLHQQGRMFLSGSSWSHGGELVIGASPTGTGTLTSPLSGLGLPGSSEVYMQGDSSLTGGITQPLDVVVGSAGPGILYLNQSFQSSTLDARNLTIGSEAAAGNFFATSATRLVSVANLLRVGRGAQATATLYGARLIAKSGLVGDGGPALAKLLLTSGASGSFTQGDGVYGHWSLPGPGSLWVARAAGSNGLVEVSGGSNLAISDWLIVGGEGRGEVLVNGDLQATRVQVGLAWGAGSGTLTTSGALTVGERRAFCFDYCRYDYTGSVSVDGNATWTIGSADGQVHGDVRIGQGGQPAGQNSELHISSGGRLSVDQGIWVGSYPTAGGSGEARLVVEPSARIRLGLYSAYDNLIIDRTGRLAGGGTVEGNVVVNGGIVAPGMSPGRLTIDGNLAFKNWSTELPGGQLIIELGGLAPGSGYDVLRVLGTLDLGSNTTLVLTTYGGFVPQPGQGFAFIEAGAIVGSFAGLIDQTGLGLTLDQFESSQGRFGYNLAQAVPEPPIVLLWLAGLVVLARVRRR